MIKLNIRNGIVSPYKRVAKRNINECIAVFEDLKSPIHITSDLLYF